MCSAWCPGEVIAHQLNLNQRRVSCWSRSSLHDQQGEGAVALHHFTGRDRSTTDNLYTSIVLDLGARISRLARWSLLQ
jgi:hypothetical protein